jgi:phosphatidylglycerophosphatase A
MNLKTLAYFVATGAGTGYAPLIPGTIGSMAALLIYILFPGNHIFWLMVIILTYFAGVWSSSIVEKDKGKDPGLIVIDEFAGQWISIIFLPASIYILLAAFLLFRILDIIKPFPANAAQELPGGWGVMTDDVIAGIYTNITLHLVLFLTKGFWNFG